MNHEQSTLQVKQQMAVTHHKQALRETESWHKERGGARGHLILCPVNVQVLSKAHRDCQRSVHIVLSVETQCHWISTTQPTNCLKGQFVFFEVGSYKVHIYSRSVLYRNHRSVQPQFGEVERRSSPDTQLCTAVNRVQRKREINHLKQGSP